MKLQRNNFSRRNGGALAAPKRSENGMATVVFIALLAIMMILVMAESRALFHLRREVKFLEQQQIKRLDTVSTNAVATAIPETK